jgi:hypothetical protein
MADFYYDFKVQNPGSIEIPSGPFVRFSNDYEITAKAEAPTLETLIDLWNAGGPYSLERVSQDPWLSAVFFRLCRAQAVRVNAGTGEVYANRREQSTVAANEIAAEVRDHPA